MYRQLSLWTSVVLALVLATAASAQTWDGGGADDLWSTAANWDADTLPTDGDDATINMDPGALIDTSVTADALDVFFDGLGIFWIVKGIYRMIR